MNDSIIKASPNLILIRYFKHLNVIFIWVIVLGRQLCFTERSGKQNDLYCTYLLVICYQTQTIIQIAIKAQLNMLIIYES